MDMNDLQIILEIKKTHSISATANSMFISQSAISRKLQVLENELGVQLIRRGRGQNQTTFTGAGEHMVSIAEKMTELYQEARSLNNALDRTRIDISCVDSVNCLLLPFVKKFCDEKPAYDVRLKTNHSWEIHEMLEAKELDVGIANSESPYSAAESLLLFTEPYVVVRKLPPRDAPLAEYVHPLDLNPAHEICQGFDTAFSRWHNYWWKPGQAKIQVWVTYLAENMFKDVEDWSILPQSVAETFAPRGYYISRLSDPPPVRRCYLIFPKRLKARNSSEVKAFYNELIEYFERRSIGFKKS